MNAGAVSKSNPVRVVSATLAALQFLLGGAALTDVVGLKLVGLLSLMVAAVQFGMGEYVRGQVTPWSDVIAKRAQDGTAVAGPASQAPTGAEVLEPEAVAPEQAAADPADIGAAAADQPETDVDDPPAIDALHGADGIAITVPRKRRARRRT